MLAIRAGIYKMLVRIANREDPDQTATTLNRLKRPLKNEQKIGFKRQFIV